MFMSKPLLLIVDDEHDICSLLRSMICKCFNLEVVVASSIEEARELFHNRVPDYALLDIQLKDGESFELIPVLKGLNPALKFMVLSAYSGAKEKTKAISLGASDFISKPFDTVVLKSKLQTMVGIHEE